MMRLSKKLMKNVEKKFRDEKEKKVEKEVKT